MNSIPKNASRRCRPACLLLTAACLLALGAPAASLKDAFKDDFLIGAALSPKQFANPDGPAAKLVVAQFNSITPENVLKWGLVHPEPDNYAFDMSDRYVAFGESNHMVIIGHTLVWHHQTPDWVFRGDNGKPADRETLLRRMRDHIHAVVGRYRGRIHGWDVVNEAVSEDGSLRESPWLKIIGEDYIAKAFQYAHEADPAAELYYNDFALENTPKRRGALALMTRLKSLGVPIRGIGLQHHDKLDWPSTSRTDATITAFAKLGLKVNITELDIDVLPSAPRPASPELAQAVSDPKLNPYTNGLPESVQRVLTRRYRDLFRVFVKHHHDIERVTFWGLTDADSWLNNWPVRGRINYPLLFDREAQPKPAFNAARATATGK